MNNPFAEIYERLGTIEGFLLALDEKLTTPPPASQLDPNRFGTPEMVCTHFNLPLATFRQKFAKQITHVKRGKRTYFKYSDVEAWLNLGRVQTTLEIEAQAQNHIDNLKTKRAK